MTAWKELELRVCRAWGGERSGPVGRDGPDCTNVPVAIQVKRTSRATGGVQGSWIRQARKDGRKLKQPWVLVVAEHGDRAPLAVTDHNWLVTMYRANTEATAVLDRQPCWCTALAPERCLRCDLLAILDPKVVAERIA